jgi:hypothetical protein
MRLACEVRGEAVLFIGALVGGIALNSATAFEQTTTIARPELQAAVTTDGFLVAQPAAGAHRVWAVGRDGSQQHLAEVIRDGEVRVVGTSAGPTAGYQDGKRIRLSRIADGRDLGMWGTNAQHLCDGVASNDKRFAVGWLEGNGGVWIVHGPTTRPRTTVDANEGELDEIAVLDVGATEQPSWCGVASAGDKVALAWRDRDRLLLGMCTAKRCGGLTASVPMHRENVILGMGCLRNACMIAHRDQRNKTVVTYVTESGSAKWSKPIETDATSVSVIGVGDNAFAVGFANRNGGHVLRFDRKGNTTQPWRGSVGSGVPQLAWSMGYLLIAHYTNDSVTPISLKLPN